MEARGVEVSELGARPAGEGDLGHWTGSSEALQGQGLSVERRLLPRSVECRNSRCLLQALHLSLFHCAPDFH